MVRKITFGPRLGQAVQSTHGPVNANSWSVSSAWRLVSLGAVVSGVEDMKAAPMVFSDVSALECNDSALIRTIYAATSATNRSAWRIQMLLWSWLVNSLYNDAASMLSCYTILYASHDHIARVRQQLQVLVGFCELARELVYSHSHAQTKQWSIAA